MASIDLCRPRGDPIVSVFQEEALIDLTAIVHEEAPVFLGKGHLPMMLFLVDDVLLYHGNTAISAEYDMVNKIVVTHNVAKYSIIFRIRHRRSQLGSPPATDYGYLFPQ